MQKALGALGAFIGFNMFLVGMALCFNESVTTVQAIVGMNLFVGGILLEWFSIYKGWDL